MVEQEPVTELCAFSSPDAVPTEWPQARGRVEDAEVYWLSTVRPDGRPHVTTLLGVWLDGALYFCTGPGNARLRTSRGTRIASSRPGATISPKVSTWWWRAMPRR